MARKPKKVPITPFQIFVLSYLYSEELFLIKREQTLDKTRLATHHLQSRILKNPIEIRVKELVTILPPSVIDRDLTTSEMINQLLILAENGFLEERNLTSSGEYGSVYITSDGILLVKKIFGNFQSAVKDKKEYEKKIESIEGNSKTKQWFKNMWSTFKEKAQDEIVDEILTQVKIQGIQLIGFMIKYHQISPT